MTSDINAHIPLQGDLSYTRTTGTDLDEKGVVVVNETVNGASTNQTTMDFLPTVRATVQKPDNFYFIANAHIPVGFTGNYVRTSEYHFPTGGDNKLSVGLARGESGTYPVFVKVPEDSDDVVHFIARVNVTHNDGSAHRDKWVLITRGTEPKDLNFDEKEFYTSSINYGYTIKDVTTGDTQVEFETQSDPASSVKYPKDDHTEILVDLEYVADDQDNVLLMQCMQVSKNTGTTMTFETTGVSGNNVSFWYVKGISWYKFPQ
jgi:hypothetical protein